MSFLIIKKVLRQIIKKISQIKIEFHQNPKTTKIKKQISLSLFLCKNSKTNIDISLAFKSNSGKPENSKGDLYLKAIDRNTWEEIDLRETDQRDGTGKGLWLLQMFGESTVKLVRRVSGDQAMSKYGSFSCKNHGLKMVKPTSARGQYWEKSIGSITFEFEDECIGKEGKAECGIKIAKSKDYKNLLTPKDKARAEIKNLYLKGQYSNIGKEINFDGELEVGDKKGKLWQLQVFKRNGTIQLTRFNGRCGSETYNDKPICKNNMFVVTKGIYGQEDSWGKSISKVLFSLINCNETLGRKVCDIKIA